MSISNWKKAIYGSEARANELVIDRNKGVSLYSVYPLLWRDNGDNSIEIKGVLIVEPESNDQKVNPIILPLGYAAEFTQMLLVECHDSVGFRRAISPAMEAGSSAINLAGLHSLSEPFAQFHWVIAVNKELNEQTS